MLVCLHFQLPDLDGHRNLRVGVAPPFRPTISLRSIVGLNGGLGLRGFLQTKIYTTSEFDDYMDRSLEPKFVDHNRLTLNRIHL